MPYGSHAFFAANNRTIGNELYRVDPDFTVHLAADVAPDPGESSSPQQMFEYMGELYFRAAFGLPGAELYKLNVDGVAELVFDATPSGGTGPSAFLPFLGSVFFRGSDGTGQRIFELGQDGDVAQISNLNPSGHDINSGLFQFGTALYFAGDNGTTGLDLYRMNADKSIELVDVIRPGTDSALISGFFIHNNALYFAADNGVNGRELWKLPAGGTDAQMVADFMPGADSSDPLVRVQVGDTPYLWAKLDPAIGRELYRLNPDDTMTLVRDSNPGPGDATIGLMFEVGGDYYFRNNTVAEGREIWRLTAAGDLELVGDFNPGPGDGPDILGVFNDELYLRFSDPVFGTEPFKLKADDTLQLIADVEPGIDSSNPSDFIVYNGSAILELNETINGQEVWRIDSNANTTRLSDIEPGDGNSNPRSMTVLNVAVGDGPDTPTNGDNNFVGTDLNDTIGLLDGNDVYAGMDGNDVVIGGAGFDTLIGLRGNDTLDGGTNPASQGDFLLGGPGDDTYFVDSALDFVDEGIVFSGFGFGGNDTILSRADFFWDLYSVGETFQVLEDAVDPEGDGVTMVAGVFDNTLIGNSKTNIMFGRGGSDTYRAGDGVDFISLSTLGLTDANAYAGVDGANTVIVERRGSGGFSYDIVFEFESLKDKFDVSDYGFASQAAAFATGFDDGLGSCYFVLGDGLDYLYVVGRTLADLHPLDFTIV